ncbi:amidohydrolase family protein [Steroidobacter cummioxidans]|uniref:amidohydrolase family protein n=1 Tax=Steroidobacter cummioxidans TaxID=1803913 RepID=UPI0019D45E21|nr:amidohydrolase family protein [Steroidobacter cummioxidans]
MEPIDTLLSARWIIPIEPAGVVLEAHSLAIHQGRILAVLPTAEAKQRFSAQEELDRPAHVLLPGLVNAHTHAASSLLHGAVSSASFEHWAHSIRQLQQRWVDAEYVRDGTALAIAAALSSGTTCFFADQHLFFPKWSRRPPPKRACASASAFPYKTRPRCGPARPASACKKASICGTSIATIH